MIPRLETIAIKKIRKQMKTNPELTKYITQTPYLTSILQDSTKRMKSTHAHEMMYLNKKDPKYIIKRFLRLQLIQSIFTLLEIEPNSIIIIYFPRNIVMEITHQLEDSRYHVFDIILERDNEHWKEFRYWQKIDAIKFIMDAFQEKSPKRISVQRSIIDLNNRPLHEFINTLQETIDIPSPDKNIIQMYNKRMVIINQYGNSPVSIFI